MPRDGTATRARILDAAEHLVIENGLAATSVDQVLAASRSSKGAFFHHFESKQALARALVDRYVAADLAQLEQAFAATAEIGDPAERVVAIVRFFEDVADEIMSEQSSCLYIAMLTERQLVDGHTTQEIRRAVVTWRQQVAALLRDAFAARAPGAPVDPEDLADHVFVTFEGAYLLCRTTGGPEPMRRQLRICRQLFESVLST